MKRRVQLDFNRSHSPTGKGRYVFPGEPTHSQPMSDNTVNAALRRLGYGKDEMTSHRFRALASPLLNEQAWPRDVIERQLATRCVPRITALSTYPNGKMMQHWADYLDKLKAGVEVIPIHQSASPT